MNKLFKSLIVLAAGSLLMVSCAKWTETESIPFEYATLQSKNPQLYEAYLASVRAYHATEHQVLIAKFDNKEAAPAGRAEHLTCLPDSVDYVIVNNPAILNKVLLEEVKQIREEKGIRSLVNVSYDAVRSSVESTIAQAVEAIDAEFAALEEEAQAARQEEFDARKAEVQSQENFQTLAKDLTLKALALVESSGVDGINVVFNGMNPVALTAEKKEAETALQEPFFTLVNEWKAGHPDALVFFEGTPAYVLAATSVVTDAAYIIIPALAALNQTAFNYAVEVSLGEGVPTYRIVIGVTAIDITDPANTNGTFTEGTAIVGAAQWAVTPASTYTKAGICVDHAQFDYFDITHVYSQINEAISIMNPSPVK